MKENSKRWYQLPLEQVFHELQTKGIGLTSLEARTRLQEYGYNELEFKKPSTLKRFLRQFHNSLVYILIAASLITGILTLLGKDMLADTIVIIGVVILNAILGFFQEGKAENALQALKDMIVPECKVYRDGTVEVLPTRELVPGDVVVLESGDLIPADLRCFETKEATADESALTGESVPVEKNTAPLEKPDLSPGDQLCMAFLVTGSTLGIVVKTGENTEFGKIATLVKQSKPVVTPLQKKITEFTKVLVITILGVGGVNFVLGGLFGYSLIYSFLASVSLIVAAIPEMLPMIVTAILAFAATVMAKRNALIRRLPAAETLGCTTVICSDKTGTLTKNEMTVKKIYAGGKEYDVTGAGYEPKGEFVFEGRTVEPSEFDQALVENLKAGYLCNNATLHLNENQYSIIGDPTEGALVVTAAKAEMTEQTRKLDEIPFNSENAYMVTLREGDTGNILYVKGSPEKLLSLSSHQLTESGPETLNRDDVLLKAGGMAQNALRVLGMAYKVVPKDKRDLKKYDLQELTFLGLQGMIDPPREEAIEAVRECKAAGIRSVMITGDHVLTAKAIATQLGITQNNDEPALVGEELFRMSDDELYEAIDKVSVFARVAPEHKLRIAQQFQKQGHIVAMTGDGVNDAPALKSADIGVAMGVTGTEVSKEASGMVLTDDNFATIVGAVEEGRHAWNNLEKAILYTLPTNAGQALLVMGAVLMAPIVSLFAVRLPLEPVQILWVNLFDSVFLTMPLMMEPKQKNILTTPPRDSNAKIANALFMQRLVLMGLAIAIPGFAVYYHFGSPAVVNGEVVDPLLLTQAQTAAFWAVLLVHFGFVMSARSVYESAFTFNPFSNKWLLAGILISILTRLLPTLVPSIAALFRTAEFPLEWWPVLLPCLLPGFLLLELDKYIRSKLSS